MTQETKLTIREQSIPSTLEDVKSLASAFAKSGMFQDAKDVAAAIVKIQAGRELGLPPVYSTQNIRMIKGQLSTSANTMALLVKSSPKYNYRIREHDNEHCLIAFYEKAGEKWEEVGTSLFTIEDAKTAQLVKPDSNWAKFPRAMLFSRAISQGARIYCPDAIGGAYTTEEMLAVVNESGSNETSETPEGVIDSTATEVSADPDWDNLESAGSQPGAELSTAPQRSKIFAAAKEQNIPEEELRKYIKFHYNLDSTKDLTKKQASDIIEAIQTGTFKFVEEQQPLPAQ